MEPVDRIFKDIRNKIAAIDTKNSAKIYLYENGIGEDGVNGYMHFDRESSDLPDALR
jgi:hypothetical protein